jgi:hypothetical protein
MLGGCGPRTFAVSTGFTYLLRHFYRLRFLPPHVRTEHLAGLSDLPRFIWPLR